MKAKEIQDYRGKENKRESERQEGNSKTKQGGTTSKINATTSKSIKNAHEQE